MAHKGWKATAARQVVVGVCRDQGWQRWCMSKESICIGHWRQCRRRQEKGRHASMHGERCRQGKRALMARKQAQDACDGAESGAAGWLRTGMRSGGSRFGNTGDGGVNRREGGRCCTCCGTREQIILLRIRPPTSGLGLHTKQGRGDGSQFRRHRREGDARLYAGAVPWRPLFSAALLTAATAAWGGTSWTGGRRAAQGRLRPGWAAARAQRHAQTARSRRRRLPQPPGRSGS